MPSNFSFGDDTNRWALLSDFEAKWCPCGWRTTRPSNWLIRRADLEKVGVAFMTMNGIISVVFLFFTTLSLYVP